MMGNFTHRECSRDGCTSIANASGQCPAHYHATKKIVARQRNRFKSKEVCARQKQITRLRLKMRGLTITGKPRPANLPEASIVYEGVEHPLSCVCFDCTFGEIARLKKIAAQGRGYVLAEDTDYQPARTGRDARGYD